MLANKDVLATVAVKDLRAAKAFYEGKLGLKSTAEDSETITYKCGGTSLLVYRSEFAGTNLATAATFNAGGDVVTAVDGLKKAGISFERYDMPGVDHQGDLHVAGGMKVAWFKDPDGNILAVMGS